MIRLLLPATLLLAPVAARAQDGAFRPDSAVDEAALDAARGGFLLPGGLDVSVAVDSVTRVGGATVLKTVFAASNGPAALSVEAADGSGGLLAVPVAAGTSVAVSGGTVRVDGVGRNTRVTLDTPALDVTHLMGQSIGSLAANRADGVSVDTATNVNVVLRDATALNLGSALLRVDGIVADAAARGAR